MKNVTPFVLPKIVGGMLMMIALLFSTTSKAQSPVLFSDDFENDSINSQAIGWELFGSTNFATVQYDSGTTNKILRVNAGATNPTGYITLRLQKTLPFSYGDIILSYKMRYNKLAGAANQTNCGNFNRFGFNGVSSAFNSDGNSANPTTTISPLGLQGVLKTGSGSSFTPTGNITLTNNLWYQITVRVSRTSATKLTYSGTISDATTSTVIKTIGGTGTTTTPTLLMNQIAFDINAIYQYNTLDFDNISIALPNAAPEASNVAINGTVETLQTLVGSYTLSGADTAGTTVQWLNSLSASGPFVVIPGANKASYTITRNDIGKYIAFRVIPASASGLLNGLPVTVVTSSPAKAHNGAVLIRSIRQSGFVAESASFLFNYSYQHPANISEKATRYTVYISDTFNLGYYKKLYTGTTTAAVGINYKIDTSLIGKYLYIELLPQDSTGAYGQFSGWTAQTAVQPEIAIVCTNYFTDGKDIAAYGGLTAGNVEVRAIIQNNHPTHDSTGKLVAQLIDGLGNTVATSYSAGAVLKAGTATTLTTTALSVPTTFDGYSFKVFFVDSVSGTKPLAQPEKLSVLDDGDAVYQYFLPDGDSTRGSYLWIPPHTPTIKGVLICIKNNIETQIMESPDVRRVAEKWGLAAISIVMSGKTYNNTLLAPPNYLSFDFTNPTCANKFDSILQGLAAMSKRPDLLNAPFIPMAHSAYMDFPFHVAMRDNTKCIAAIPIKSGVPNIYTYYKGKANGGSSNLPATSANMKDVPLLFYQGFMPETVDMLFKTSPMRPVTQSLSAGFAGIYRQDDSTGNYKPQNEFGGAILDLAEGHFNTLPRAVKIIATFIDKACAARLPDVYPTNPSIKPVLKPLNFTNGWLVDQNYQNNLNPTKYAKPAPYSQFKGSKKGSLWYFDQEMATLCEQLAVTEYNKKVEQFTILRPDGTPDTLFQCVYCYHPKDGFKYTDSTNKMKMTLFSFDKPWPIDTASANTKDTIKVTPKLSTNVLLPGVKSLPITNLPVHAKTSASCYKHLGNLNFKLRFYRYNPSAGGYTQSYVTLYKEGNDSVAESVRTVRLDRTQSTNFTGLKSQFITFPSINPIDVNTRSVQLNATASSSLPVEYFVRSGPAIVIDNKLIISQIPDNAPLPIAISVAAYQVGSTVTGGYFAAPTVYLTIWINDIAPKKPLLLAGQATAPQTAVLNWNTSADTLVNGYSIWRNDSELAITSDTLFIDTTVSPNTNYKYYVKALNKLGNYSDTTNNVYLLTPAPLPISQLKLTANLGDNNTIHCNWQTTNEISTSYFELERSTNAISFSKLSSLAAKGGSAKYNFSDVLTSEISPVYYYRIKAFDKDGKFQYSNTAKVTTTLPEIAITAAPNPFKEKLNLQITVSKASEGLISITSTSGDVLIKQKQLLAKGNNFISLPQSSKLAKGIYVVNVSIGSLKKTIAVVKQ